MVEDSRDRITVREAAKIVGRTAETVRRWIWDGKLPAQKLGNQLFVKRSDLMLVSSRTRELDSAERLAAADELAAIRERIAQEVGGASDVLDELRAHREKIAKRLGGTLDIIRMLDESRESHP